MKAFLVALALGLLATGVAYVVDTQVDLAPEQPSLAPFTSGNGTSTFLLLLQDHASWGHLDTCQGQHVPPGGRVVMMRLEPGCGARHGDLSWHVAEATHPVKNATRLLITWYIFDEQARLVASNADDMRRFLDHPDQQHIEANGLYLGEGRAPSGFEGLPIPAPELESAIHDAHVGGVVSLYVDDHPHVGYLGPVYVTLRIDQVVG